VDVKAHFRKRKGISIGTPSSRLYAQDPNPRTLIQARRLNTGIQCCFGLLFTGGCSKPGLAFAFFSRPLRQKDRSLSGHSGLGDSITCRLSGIFGGVSTGLAYLSLAEQYDIRDYARDEKQSSEDRYGSVSRKLCAVVLSVGLLILSLLSFYFAKTSVDNKTFVNIWKLLLSLACFVAAHIAGYLALVWWNL
jgi:hypothetical protein